MNETTSAFVVADAHGRHDLVDGLLEQEGLLGDHAGVTVIQIGDLCNCVASSVDADLECLRRASDWFDVLLLGNHEHPYFGGPAFSGFWRDPEVETAMRRLDWNPSFAIGEFLVTHAGVTRAFNLAGPAEEADKVLRIAWADDPGRHPFFASISRHRGGNSEWAGILWADWQEPKSTAGFSQIVGHTPGPIRVQGQPARVKDMKVLGHNADPARFTDGRPDGFDPDEPFALCIDLGASKGGKNYATASGKPEYPEGPRLAGCWIRDSKVEIATYGGQDQVAA